jgi:hypothetical protein
MRKWDKWEKEIQEGRLKERKTRSWMKSSAVRWIVSNLTLLWSTYEDGIKINLVFVLPSMFPTNELFGFTQVKCHMFLWSGIDIFSATKYYILQRDT